ncbi:hypothetical protein T4B_14028, partial [Trichinella pseudospiralis]
MQSVSFTDPSLDKYRIVFDQTLQHSLRCRYVSHFGRKLSNSLTMKIFRKKLFHTKRENSTGFENFIKKLEVRNGLGRTLPDCIFHEIFQKSHMELKYDFNGGEWKGNQICNLKSCWPEVNLL